MGLSDDQKAMLRLLAQREEGYEDMAKLMGISVEEVRERVKEALAEVEEPVAVEETASEPPVAPASATPEPPPVEEPAAPTPPAPAPEPAAPAVSAPAQPRARKRSARPPGLEMPRDRGALIGLGAGALVVILLVIVLIVGGDDGGGHSSTTASDGNQSGAGLTAAEEHNLTQAVLVPSGNQEASGRALFGRFKQSVLLQAEAEGLEPSPQGMSYTVWLYRSPKLALQVGSVRVRDDGRIAAQFQIPAQLLDYVANGAFDQIDVSLTSIAEYKAAFNKAKSENKVPPYVGESVLRGEITGPAVQTQQ